MTKKLAEALIESYKVNESEMDPEVKPEPEVEVEEAEVEPAVEAEIDTDDAQLLAVVNVYFKKINAKPAATKADKLEKLVHRLINSMIEMPRGEKEARIALKLAIKEINA